MEDILVPIALFAMVGFIVAAGFYFGHKTRASAYQTLQAVINRGEPVSADVIKAIRLPVRPKKADLRRGVVLLAIAAAFVVFGWGIAFTEIDAREAWGPFLGMASFPGLVGLAFIALHFIARQDED